MVKSLYVYDFLSGPNDPLTQNKWSEQSPSPPLTLSHSFVVLGWSSHRQKFHRKLTYFKNLTSSSQKTKMNK